jgi:transketolase
MSTDGGCFIGASLSCADILVYLYSHVLRVNPADAKDPERDYFILSKGHDVPALYAVFSEIGLLDPARLKDHLTTRDDIYWHPNRNVPGVEFHSGSLGHGLAVGIGFAMALRLDGKPNRVVVLLGDGEMNEGSIWESLLIANAYRLDNLIVVVDRNKFQANVRTEDLVPLEPMLDKVRAFGWEAHRCDGHDFDAMHRTFTDVMQRSKSGPRLVIADTIRGRGLPSIEEQATRWFVNFSHEEVEKLLVELRTGVSTTLDSQEIIAR